MHSIRILFALPLLFVAPSLFAVTVHVEPLLADTEALESVVDRVTDTPIIAIIDAPPEDVANTVDNEWIVIPVDKESGVRPGQTFVARGITFNANTRIATDFGTRRFVIREVRRDRERDLLAWRMDRDDWLTPRRVRVGKKRGTVDVDRSCPARELERSGFHEALGL